MKLLFFDLETTGVNPGKNGIHQISGEIVIDGVSKEQFDFHVQPNPRAIIEDEALKVAGVTREQVLAYPPMRQVYSEFVAMLEKYVDKYNKKDKFFLVGYNNAAFDNQFLRGFFLQNGDQYFGSWFWSNTIDVMVLASAYLATRLIIWGSMLMQVIRHGMSMGITKTENRKRLVRSFSIRTRIFARLNLCTFVRRCL